MIGRLTIFIEHLNMCRGLLESMIYNLTAQLRGCQIGQVETPIFKPKPELVPPLERPTDHLLNAREVAEILCVDVSWVKNHCRRVKPYIPYVQWETDHGQHVDSNEETS
jgi:hypothetical protein